MKISTLLFSYDVCPDLFMHDVNANKLWTVLCRQKRNGKK